ncbi:hypothetical protein IQ279_20965 [Streptomyces verrucosisporus]|uniref:hypothetical protein n=1 Tax=Streptomyces verrucosisporus TaxID=1695161 RepID=UPI0019D0E00B|nr:hypothetical protein [Streptomyces verrucosisporus]MBN3932062.1 hypothetical protein [Streptomyces verrucosisporus]
MELTDEALSDVVADLGGVDPGQWDSSDLVFLVMTAQSNGLLDGVVVQELIPLSRRDDSFLVTVMITERITVSSAPVHWREVAPAPDLRGSRAVRQLLERIDRIAADLREGFATDAVLRDSTGLARLDELVRAARFLEVRWEEESQRFQDGEGNIADSELRGYDQLRCTRAFEAWEIANSLASCPRLRVD